MEEGGGPGVPMVTPLEMVEEGTCYERVCVCVCVTVSFPGLPVLLSNNIQKWKSSEKWGKAWSHSSCDGHKVDDVGGEWPM